MGPGTTSRRRRRPARDRRGVLILVVLSLLILFVVIAVMFVVVASRARAVSRVYSEFGRTGDTPQEIIDGIAHDLIRGSVNPYSPFRSTSLLEDIYGHYSLRGIVSANPPPTRLAGGLVDIVASPLNTFSTVKDAYSGCVLTFISGPARGLSARILEYWPPNSITGLTEHKFRLMSIASEYGYDQPVPVTAIQQNGIFVINGRPFSGTGVGYNAGLPLDNPGLGRLTAIDPGSMNPSLPWPYALLPNPVFFRENPDYAYTDPAGPGGANEDYDAPDFQNPFLAFYSTPNPTAPNQIKPSFHDPALLEYWWNQPGTPDNPDLIRKILFRPSIYYQPVFNQTTNPALYNQFDKRNPKFAQGPWDIDNDGDGLADSIWIDPGYPVQVTKQGRTYKVLVAPLILDLDGRLNVNVHGSLQELPSNPPTQFPSAQTTAPLAVLAGGAGTIYQNPPRGSGYGPAEIRLSAVLGAANINAIFSGGTFGGATYSGRYGLQTDGLPGRANFNDSFSAVKLFGVTDANDQWPGRPGGEGGTLLSMYVSPPDLKGRLAVALDPTGQPVWDKPDWTKERIDNPYEFDVSRYSARGLGNSGNGPYDSPFSVGELERLLRPADIDTATLPPRLALAIAADLNAAPALRNALTTDNWDLPVPNMVPAPHMRGWFASANQPTDRRMTSLADLVHARAANVNAQQAATIVDALLSPEVRRGSRMDINRPFGNGVDGDGDPNNRASQNGIVDDALEFRDKMDFSPVGLGTVPFDQSNDQDVNFDGKSDGLDRFLSRQLLARHLYVLMMLCTDDNFTFPLSIIPRVPTQAPSFDDQNSKDLQLQTANDQPRKAELKAKRLAQWAINVVDFRDADNIMTGFEFDLQPFDGWSVDGDLTTDENQGKPRNQWKRAVVWGCEMPVALLTETLAFHDRRVKDTDHDDGSGKKRDDSKTPDPTLDQPLIPRGSAFVEIMAIFNSNVGVQSSDLFVWDTAINEWKLDLGKLAPDGKPIWRLAVTEFHTDAPVDRGHEPVSGIVSEHPDTVSLQPFLQNDGPNTQPNTITPWNFSLLNQPLDTHDVNIERLVWMSNRAPTGADADRTFYSTAASPRDSWLGGFQYAVVGPGGTGAGARISPKVQGIMVGWRSDNVPANTQQIRLGTRVTFSGTANDPAPNTKPAIGIPVASPAGRIKSSDATIGAWGANDRVGFSISEPLFSDAMHYYPKPSVINTDTELEEAYGDEADNAKKFLDTPLDSDINNPEMPLLKRDMLKTGTYMNVRTVFLQRLADPTRQHDPVTNPYLTVDWMPFDLTVFNGEDEKPANSMVDPWDPDDPTPDTNPPVHFTTRERGKVSTAQSTRTDYNVWTPVSEEPADTQPSKPPEFYFRHALVHSLGYLNKSYGQPQASPNPNLVGGPVKPFPWIRWANRPFVNALELMEVPASTPARLLLEFNYVQPTATPPTESPYAATPSQNPFARPFNHLLNFFHASDLTGQNPGTSGDFYRLFEFVHVPSPFVGTETMLDPRVFQTPDTSQGPAAGAGGAGTEHLRAPFNWVSNYRDPGKINLNTINSPGVWDALMGVQQGQRRIPFGEFWNNRRGGPAPAAGTIATTPVQGLPTIMANVYRSGAGGDMVPDLPGAGVNSLKTEGVHHTLLRKRLVSGGVPLFADPSTDPNQSNQQLSVAIDANRNAAFRYHDLERLANLTTTRSNVYAIWLTVGYFEVFPNPGGIDAGHPDGYQIGAELGSDTGEIERHRGFYILDRSIPVGFERGFNHNVDRAILVKRFIE